MQSGAEDRASHVQSGPGRRVTFSPSGITVFVEPGETVVDGLRRQGLRTRYKCRRGGCGVCRAIVLSGRVSYPTGVSQDVIAGSGAPGAGGQHQCLPCRAVPEADVHLLLGPTDKVTNVLGGILPSTATPPYPNRPEVGSHERKDPCLS